MSELREALRVLVEAPDEDLEDMLRWAPVPYRQRLQRALHRTEVPQSASTTPPAVSSTTSPPQSCLTSSPRTAPGTTARVTAAALSPCPPPPPSTSSCQPTSSQQGPQAQGPPCQAIAKATCAVAKASSSVPPEAPASKPTFVPPPCPAEPVHEAQQPALGFFAFKNLAARSRPFRWSLFASPNLCRGTPHARCAGCRYSGLQSGGAGQAPTSQAGSLTSTGRHRLGHRRRAPTTWRACKICRQDAARPQKVLPQLLVGGVCVPLDRLSALPSTDWPGSNARSSSCLSARRRNMGTRLDHFGELRDVASWVFVCGPCWLLLRSPPLRLLSLRLPSWPERDCLWP